MPTSIDFIVALFGCLYAKLIPVPVARPSGTPRSLSAAAALITDIARNCGPAAIMCTAVDKADLAARLSPEIVGLPLLTLPVDGEAASTSHIPHVGPDTPALLQYTSGSTSAPKGVVLTHRNLLANLRVLSDVIFKGQLSPIVVNWLPLYHDLGLIGGVLGPLFCGGHCLLMPTESFLRRPTRWLQAISRFRADISLAPNFAYDLTVRALRPGLMEQLDLSSWKVAINCAEPVRPATLERFVAAFAPFGFNRAAFMPCYGLAEASLMVTATPRETGAVEDSRAPGLIGSGRVPKGAILAIAGPTTRSLLPEGEEGEVWVAGDSVAGGYWGHTQADAFEGTLLTDTDGRRWLRTGDLGRMLEGELFITGRLKDVIKIAGRQIHPQDIERYIQTGDLPLKLGASIAFGLARVDGEVLALAQETRLTDPAEHEKTISLLRARVFDGFAISLDTVLLLRPGTMPKTLNGKLQRSACRQAAERGELSVLASSSLLGARV